MHLLEVVVDVPTQGRDSMCHFTVREVRAGSWHVDIVWFGVAPIDHRSGLLGGKHPQYTH